MKNILILLVVTATLTSSCRKIIDIELEEANKRTTIDAQIHLGTNTVTTRITKSGNFFGETTNPALTDATVVLNDGTTDYNLINMGDGDYELTNFTALPGQNYSLKVTQGGTTFDATTYMPVKVELDTVLAQFQPASTFNDSGYIVSLLFNDPAAIANYYRIELDIAGVRYGPIEDLILFDDELTNGNSVNFPLFGVDVAQLGDTVTVYLISLDKQSYDYFNAIDEILFGNAATPANPKSNFNNDALGNFSAFATDTMTIVVQ